jgi:hypothetical protein
VFADVVCAPAGLHICESALAARRCLAIAISFVPIPAGRRTKHVCSTGGLLGPWLHSQVACLFVLTEAMLLKGHLTTRLPPAAGDDSGGRGRLAALDNPALRAVLLKIVGRLPQDHEVRLLLTTHVHTTHPLCLL